MSGAFGSENRRDACFETAFGGVGGCHGSTCACVVNAGILQFSRGRFYNRQ